MDLVRRYSHGDHRLPDRHRRRASRWTRWSLPTAGTSCTASTSTSRARRLSIDNSQLAGPLVTRFEEIWATGEPGVAGTVLGL